MKVVYCVCENILKIRFCWILNETSEKQRKTVWIHSLIDDIALWSEFNLPFYLLYFISELTIQSNT